MRSTMDKMMNVKTRASRAVDASIQRLASTHGLTHLEPPPTTDTPTATGLQFPAPLDYESIVLLDKTPSGERISYTDCMESSCLRFVQVMCCDATSLDKCGRPTRVDLNFVRTRVRDAQVRAFFEVYPEILPPLDYSPGKRGYKAREAWARLVTHRPFFTYKRSACGVYKNEWLEGDTKGSFQWKTEMEPCVHNVIGVCRHFLGVDFAEEDAVKPMWNRRCDTNHEALTHDVSADAQPHLAAAMGQLSRRGVMDLQARVMPPQARFWTTYDTVIEFDVNGVGAWKWRLQRKLVTVPKAVLEAVGGDKDEEATQTSRIRTSYHSVIDTF